MNANQFTYGNRYIGRTTRDISTRTPGDTLWVKHYHKVYDWSRLSEYLINKELIISSLYEGSCYSRTERQWRVSSFFCLVCILMFDNLLDFLALIKLTFTLFDLIWSSFLILIHIYLGVVEIWWIIALT